MTHEQAEQLEDEVSLELRQADSGALAEEWNLLMMLSTLSLWGFDRAPAVSDFATPFASSHAIVSRHNRGVVSQMIV